MTRVHPIFRWRSLIFLTLMVAVAAPTYPVMPDPPGGKLEKAREDLRISISTQKRIAAGIEALRRSGGASPEILKEYETYLENVALMVEENRRIVKGMEAALSGRTGAETGADERDPNVLIPEEEMVHRLTILDRELNASLSAFDDMLLQELERIRAASAQKMQDLAVKAADAARRLKETEANRGVSEQGDAQAASGESEHGGDGKPYTAPGGEKDPASETAGREADPTRPGKKGETRPDPERSASGSAQDDDIVARQLREAAENETDPDLREKLWQKYEEYKNSTRN